MTQLDKNRTRQESVRGLRAPKSTAQDLIGSANEIFEKMKDPPTRRPRKVWNGYCQGSSSDFWDRILISGTVNSNIQDLYLQLRGSIFNRYYYSMMNGIENTNSLSTTKI